MKPVQIGNDGAADPRPLTAVVIATPHAGTSGTFAILEVLRSVGRSWELLHGDAPRAPRFRPCLLSLDGAPYATPSGILVHPHGKLADEPAPDIVIVPELLVDLSQPLPEHYGPVARWIRSAYDNGAIVTSVCSGTLLVAKTGLLDGAEATTHWGYCDSMARHFPNVRVRKERVLVPAGDGHRIITAGGASSWYDLLLYLVARFVSPEEARRVAKVWHIAPHEHGQLHFAGLPAKRRAEDQAVASAQAWIADNYKNANPVAAMAARSGLTERSFLARFRRATGMSPMDYVQALRIEEAKHLLETTDIALDEIAVEMGYVEPASFRRLFRKSVGLSPSAYRRQCWRMPAS